MLRRLVFLILPSIAVADPGRPTLPVLKPVKKKMAAVWGRKFHKSSPLPWDKSLDPLLRLPCTFLCKIIDQIVYSFFHCFAFFNFISLVHIQIKGILLYHSLIFHTNESWRHLLVQPVRIPCFGKCK